MTLLARLLCCRLAVTRDASRAARSRWYWLDSGDGWYQLRVLGVVNGLLHRFDVNLVVRSRQTAR